MEKDELNDSIGLYSTLLQKYFESKLSLDERHQLAQWLWSDRKNRLLFEKLRSEKILKKYYQSYQAINPDEEYRLLLARYPKLTSPRVPSLYWVRWIAAVFLIMLGSGSAFLFFRSSSSDSESLPSEKSTMAIVLRTADGKIFHLDEQNDWSALEQKGLQVRDSLKQLVCSDLPVTDSISLHQLDIPRGGEYKMVLSDGTKVWLNSESGIQFPVAFGNNSREITVYGEVYLEVARDEERPFQVVAGAGKVEVLGTKFGISVYPSDQIWETTLVQGSVRVNYGQQTMVLSPGRQAFVVQDKLKEQIVDTDKELAWTRGEFVFEHDRLEEVVKRLSRWYDVEFRFGNDDLKTYVFTGQVSRDNGIDHILDLMERMNVVRFEKKDGYILIKEKAGEY